MDKCSKCGSDFKLVPAGVSKKSNRAYQAFWSCTNRECGATAPGDLKPVAPRTFTKTKEPNWDAIAEGKVRTHLMGAMLAAGKSNQEIAQRLPALVQLALTGKGVPTQNQVSEVNEGIEEEMDINDLPF